MSAEFAQYGSNQPQHRSQNMQHHAVSPATSCEEELSDDQTKINSSPSSQASSMSPSPALDVDSAIEPPPLQTTGSPPSKHAFSIDALVGGNNKCYDFPEAAYSELNRSKMIPDMPTDIISSNPWMHANLIELKRIQAYYQQLYNQTVSLKQLNQLSYLYPMNNGSERLPKLFPDIRQHDQLLAYYANLYLQNSSHYQERYLESLKAYSSDSVDNTRTKNNGISRANSRTPSEEQFIASQQSQQEKAAPRSDRKDSSQILSMHAINRQSDSPCQLGLPITDDNFFNVPTSRNDVPSKLSFTSSISNADHLALSQLRTTTTSSHYSRSPLLMEKQANTTKETDSLALMNNVSPIIFRESSHQHHQNANDHGHHHLSASGPLNSSSYYPSYNEYDLLVNNNNNNNASGIEIYNSSNHVSSARLRSPLLSASPDGDVGCDGKRSLAHSPSTTPSASDNQNVAAAAAAAYHLTSMFRKPKRIRTAFSPGQLLRLEEIFEKNRYVVGCERKQLARDLNLSETQIKVWFQNRRTKHKREKHVSGGHNNNHQSQHLQHHRSDGRHSPSKRSHSLQSSFSSTSSSSGSSGSGSMQHMTTPSTYLSKGNFLGSTYFKGSSNTGTLLAK